MDLSHIINQLGEEDARHAHAIAPPLFQASNFCFETVNDLRAAIADEYHHTLYSRGNNPTVDLLRKKLAALDGAEDSLVLSSGAAAIFLAVFANVRAGDHVVCVQNPYSWTDRLFRNLLPRFGVTATMVDGTQVDNFEKALLPETRVIFLESPNTLTYELQDLKAVAALAKTRNIVTIIDNSYCSSLNQQPIKLGIDLSVQTATKFLGGHSDTLAGVVSGSREMIQKMFNSDFLNTGACLSPFNAWLLLRSMRTLHLRVTRSGASAQSIVKRLTGHPKIERIYYPSSSDFTQAHLARLQMQGPGAMFTLALNTSTAAGIETFCQSLNRFLIAVSWGGHESLVFPAMASMPDDSFNSQLEKSRLVRLYIGLEDPEVLAEDIEKALERI